MFIENEGCYKYTTPKESHKGKEWLDCYKYMTPSESHKAPSPSGRVGEGAGEGLLQGTREGM